MIPVAYLAGNGVMHNKQQGRVWFLSSFLRREIDVQSAGSM